MLLRWDNSLTVKKKMVKLINIAPGHIEQVNMQEKQKVTLYLPPILHRQLKVKAAIDTDSMSAIVEKAISFYLKHPEAVEEVEASYGKTHQVHICPECDAAMVMRDGEMISLKNQPSVVDEELPLLGDSLKVQGNAHDQEELIPC
jgi:hypothetical protein